MSADSISIDSLRSVRKVLEFCELGKPESCESWSKQRSRDLVKDRNELFISAEVQIEVVFETLPRHRRLTFFWRDEEFDFGCDLRFSLSTKHDFRFILFEVFSVDGVIFSLKES